MTGIFHRGFGSARAWGIVLALSVSMLGFAVPASGQASDATSYGEGVGGTSISGECWIESWGCEEEVESAPQVCHGEFCSYIVVFWDWVEDPAVVAHEQVEKYGGNLGFVYKYALKGYSAEYRPSVVDDVACEPTVRYVQEDQIVEVFGASSAGQGGPADAFECIEQEPEQEPEQESEPEPEPEPELEQEPEPAVGGGDADGRSADIGIPDIASMTPVSQHAAVKHCAQGSIHRAGRCVRKRQLARRACRKKAGAAKRRCIQHTMGKAQSR